MSSGIVVSVPWNLMCRSVGIVMSMLFLEFRSEVGDVFSEGRAVVREMRGRRRRESGAYISGCVDGE